MRISITRALLFAATIGIGTSGQSWIDVELKLPDRTDSNDHRPLLLARAAKLRLVNTGE